MDKLKMKLFRGLCASVLIGLPTIGLACGGYRSSLEVIEPWSVESLVAKDSNVREMEAGDRFVIILPRPRKGTVLEVSEASDGVLKAFTPSDKSGPNVFAWILMKEGSTTVTITERDDAANRVNLKSFYLKVRPDTRYPVLLLDESNVGQTFSFTQRAILRVKLAHPNNLEGYWQVDAGLNDMDVASKRMEFIRGKQVQVENRWMTEINIGTTHMPKLELRLSFHTPQPSWTALFTRPVFYKLQGMTAAAC